MTLTPTLASIRFGLGLPLSADMPVTAEAMLQRLTGPDEMADLWPIAGMAELGPAYERYNQLKVAARKDESQLPAVAAEETNQREMTRKAARATWARMLDSRDPLRERLAEFWFDHFTVVAPAPRDGARPAAMVDDAIRPHLTGDFATLLTEVSLHPAMLIYLDQAQSIGPNSPQGARQGRGLNENFSREVMELHTLGVGASYDQEDVRQLAKALTGLTYDTRRGVRYYRRRAEPGAEEVLGVTYEGESLDTVRRVLADLAARPETVAHLSRKLAVHFVSDTPDPALVAAIEAAWTRGGGALLPVYEALLTHPAAADPVLAKARQPWDFMVAALRALGVTGDDLMGWTDDQMSDVIWIPLAKMGQPWRRPGGPDGWREEIGAWINPQGLAARIEWAMKQPERLVRSLPEPVEFARHALGDLTPEVVVWAAARAEQRSDGVGIVLASSEFNRR
ncbi:hypothetical protein MASR2M74_28500 [Paracoccaceae bacterium]